MGTGTQFKDLKDLILFYKEHQQLRDVKNQAMIKLEEVGVNCVFEIQWGPTIDFLPILMLNGGSFTHFVEFSNAHKSGRSCNNTQSNILYIHI